MCVYNTKSNTQSLVEKCQPRSQKIPMDKTSESIFQNGLGEGALLEAVSILCGGGGATNSHIVQLLVYLSYGSVFVCVIAMVHSNGYN